MKRVNVYLILLPVLFLHLTVLNYIKIFDAKPDLMLALVIFFGLFGGWRMGLEAGLAAGFLEDIFTLDIFWINTFILGITGILAGGLKTKFFKESKITQTFFVFLFATFSMIVHFLSASAFIKSVNVSLADYFITSVIPASVYTALVSIPVFSKLVKHYDLEEKDSDLL